MILGRTLLLLFLCENILYQNPFSLQTGGQRAPLYNNIPIDEKTLNRILPIFFPKEEDYQRNNRRDTVIFLVYSATDLIFSYYSREMREGKGGRVRPLRQVHVE